MAVLSALYAVLDYYSVGLGSTVKVTFAGLPVLVAAVYFGPLPAALTGLTGALISQLMRYGLSWTTPFWILPAALRGVVMGGLYRLWGRRRSLPGLFAPTLISSLAVTGLNTLLTYWDSVLFGYFVPGLIVGVLGFRLISSVLTSVLYALALWPLLRRLPPPKKGS